MVNRGEEKVWVQMNVVPRSTGNTNSGTRELTLKCKLKCYFKPMNNPPIPTEVCTRILIQGLLPCNPLCRT